jgi:hypothetical protein
LAGRGSPRIPPSHPSRSNPETTCATIPPGRAYLDSYRLNPGFRGEPSYTANFPSLMQISHACSACMHSIQATSGRNVALLRSPCSCPMSEILYVETESGRKRNVVSLTEAFAQTSKLTRLMPSALHTQWCLTRDCACRVAADAIQDSEVAA